MDPRCEALLSLIRQRVEASVGESVEVHMGPGPQIRFLDENRLEVFWLALRGHEEILGIGPVGSDRAREIWDCVRSGWGPRDYALALKLLNTEDPL